MADSRFKSLTEEEIGELLNDKDSKNTQKSTKACRLVFEAYLQEKSIQNPKTAEELATVLPRFYTEVRRKDGQLYTKSSLCAIRFGLCRHFKQVLNIDIIKDKEFNKANRVYEARCAELRKQGLAKTEHKPPIDDGDMNRLYHSGLFNTAKPHTLQNKVFFEVMFFFGRGGRGNLRQLKKNDFVIKVNSQGKRYMVKTTDERTKSHEAREVLGGKGVMVASDGPFCPVYSFEKYLSHLNPSNEFLFQRPRVSDYGLVWYENMAIGEHALGKKMQELSEQARLSKIYTNFSIRATNMESLLAVIGSGSKNQHYAPKTENREKQDREKSEKKQNYNEAISKNTATEELVILNKHREESLKERNNSNEAILKNEATDELAILNRHIEESLKEGNYSNEAISKNKASKEMQLIEDQKSVINFYSRLTGISLSCDNTSRDTSSFQSFNCTFFPDPNSTHGLQFRLTHDKEFDEIEYSPNPRSPGSEDVLKSLPDYLQENIFFGADQAPKFLAKLLKTAQ